MASLPILPRLLVAFFLIAMFYLLLASGA